MYLSIHPRDSSRRRRGALSRVGIAFLFGVVSPESRTGGHPPSRCPPADAEELRWRRVEGWQSSAGWRGLKLLCESRSRHSAAGPEHQQLRTRMQEQRECTYPPCASERVIQSPTTIPDLLTSRARRLRNKRSAGWVARGRRPKTKRALFSYCRHMTTSDVVTTADGDGESAAHARLLRPITSPT